MIHLRFRCSVNANVIGFALFAVGITLASDCSAQRLGRLRQRGPFTQPAARSIDYRLAAPAPPVFPAEQYNQRRNSLVSRILDPPGTSAYRNPAEVDSRYIGGFHRSQFDNIGLPSGDIGLRGNSLYWRPW